MAETTGRWTWAWVCGLIVFLIAATATITWRATSSFSRHQIHRHYGAAGDALFDPANNLDSASDDLRRAVADRVIPGAALAIGEHQHILEVSGYGRVGWSQHDESVSPDSTMYDLASLTKAVATTTAVLLLVQDGRIRLDDPVQPWLPDFTGKWKDRVTWRHLLTHTAGLPASAKVRGRTAAERLHNIIAAPLNEPPGQDVAYSDVSAIILWAAAGRAAGEPVPDFLERRVWRPLGMHATEFWPGMDCENCAPTQSLKSGKPYRGKPTDPLAHKVGVPTGNAGLFSTAHDLARFAAMIANGGELDGVRILKPELVRELFTQQPKSGHRSLGWMAFCPDEQRTQQQPCDHPIAYGHTGWTGTSLWIDPKRGVWVVILSNRSYSAKRPPSLDSLREEIFTDVASEK